MAKLANRNSVTMFSVAAWLNQKIINNLKMLTYLNSGFQNLKFSKIEEN